MRAYTVPSVSLLSYRRSKAHSPTRLFPSIELPQILRIHNAIGAPPTDPKPALFAAQKRVCNLVGGWLDAFGRSLPVVSGSNQPFADVLRCPV
jgi:hypothetical protein